MSVMICCTTQCCRCVTTGPKKLQKRLFWKRYAEWNSPTLEGSRQIGCVSVMKMWCQIDVIENFTTKTKTKRTKFQARKTREIKSRGISYWMESMVRNECAASDFSTNKKRLANNRNRRRKQRNKQQPPPPMPPAHNQRAHGIVAPAAKSHCAASEEKGIQDYVADQAQLCSTRRTSGAITCNYRCCLAYKHITASEAW